MRKPWPRLFVRRMRPPPREGKAYRMIGASSWTLTEVFIGALEGRAAASQSGTLAALTPQGISVYPLPRLSPRGGWLARVDGRPTPSPPRNCQWQLAHRSCHLRNSLPKNCQNCRNCPNFQIVTSEILSQGCHPGGC